MKKELLKTLFGLDSFFELWNGFIVPHGFQNREKLSVQDQTPGCEGQTYIVDMQEIKALAFDEIYSSLPTAEQIRQASYNVDRMREQNQVINFLQLIPTKVK